MSEKKVTVYELLKRTVRQPDGTEKHEPAGLGNSSEVSLEEAIFLIENKNATSGIHPIGVVPPEWLEPERSEAEKTVAEEHGISELDQPRESSPEEGNDLEH